MSSKKPLNVTQQYAKRIVEIIENADVFGRYFAAERMLHQFFTDRMTEFEAEVDEILANTNPTANFEGLSISPYPAKLTTPTITPAILPNTLDGLNGVILPTDKPAKNVAEVKARSGKKNMKVPNAN